VRGLRGALWSVNQLITCRFGYPPQYARDASWGELLGLLNATPELREALGVKLCPFSGQIEEYTLLHQTQGKESPLPTPTPPVT